MMMEEHSKWQIHWHDGKRLVGRLVVHKGFLGDQFVWSTRDGDRTLVFSGASVDKRPHGECFMSTFRSTNTSAVSGGSTGRAGPKTPSIGMGQCLQVLSHEFDENSKGRLDGECSVLKIARSGCTGQDQDASLSTDQRVVIAQTWVDGKKVFEKHPVMQVNNDATDPLLLRVSTSLFENKEGAQARTQTP
jgi:hypothetical protein